MRTMNNADDPPKRHPCHMAELAVKSANSPGGLDGLALNVRSHEVIQISLNSKFRRYQIIDSLNEQSKVAACTLFMIIGSGRVPAREVLKHFG
jgi:hypothetical protein